MDKRFKQKLANVEHYGKVEGNYAQLTPIALRDLQQQGKFKDVTLSEVKSDAKLYDEVVDAYSKRMEDFGVPSTTKDKVIWWRAPALYKKCGGDISKIDDNRLRNKMENRVKNYGSPLSNAIKEKKER